MKDWSDLEERYQDMRSEDPNSAEDFKKAMTERFQKTVQVEVVTRKYFRRVCLLGKTFLLMKLF